jgi:hypothetical protein
MMQTRTPRLAGAFFLRSMDHSAQRYFASAMQRHISVRAIVCECRADPLLPRKIEA